MQEIKEPYVFREVALELTETDDAFTSGKLHILGYCPTFLNTGTHILFVNNRPIKPGDQWEENVPPQYPIDKDYDLVMGQGLEGQPDILGLVTKQGTWLRVSYYKRVLNTLQNV